MNKPLSPNEKRRSYFLSHVIRSLKWWMQRNNSWSEGNCSILYYPKDIEHLRAEFKKLGVKKVLIRRVRKSVSYDDKTHFLSLSVILFLLKSRIWTVKSTEVPWVCCGEKAEVNRVGTTYRVVNSEKGKTQKSLFLFLQFTLQSLVDWRRATLDMNEEPLINAHINLFEYIRVSQK